MLKLKICCLIIYILYFNIVSICSQDTKPGKYQICINQHGNCHHKYTIDLKEDGSFLFVYTDKYQLKRESGTWTEDSDYIYLDSDPIADTFVVSDVYEIPNRIRMNEILFLYDDGNIEDLKIYISNGGKNKEYEANREGRVFYKGDVADSISIFCEGKKFIVRPKRKESPSFITIKIDSNYKGLVQDNLNNNKILKKEGKLIVRYIDWMTGDKKFGYFEKIE